MTKAKMARYIIQVVDHLPNKHKTLGSNPVPQKKKENLLGAVC
jgi:hypothetical protein